MPYDDNREYLSDIELAIIVDAFGKLNLCSPFLDEDGCNIHDPMDVYLLSRRLVKWQKKRADKVIA